VEKNVAPKNCVTTASLQNLPKVNNLPLGETSPNPVTLLCTYVTGAFLWHPIVQSGTLS
jgi:hypothetical protein